MVVVPAAATVEEGTGRWKKEVIKKVEETREGDEEERGRERSLPPPHLKPAR